MYYSLPIPCLKTLAASVPVFMHPGVLEEEYGILCVVYRYILVFFQVLSVRNIKSEAG